MAIRKATLEELGQCVDVLFIPELGKLYFPKRDLLRAELEKGIVSDEVYVYAVGEGWGVNSKPLIQGVIWYQREGLFHSFPYLHMIAVRDECRGQGIGAAMMDFYERDALRNGRSRFRIRAFLLVNDLNSSAKQFYRNRDYTEISKFENLFRNGVSEILMMNKVKTAP